MQFVWLWEIEAIAGSEYYQHGADYMFECGCWANSQRKKHAAIGKYSWERCHLHGGPAERKPIRQVIDEMRPAKN